LDLLNLSLVSLSLSLFYANKKTKKFFNSSSTYFHLAPAFSVNICIQTFDENYLELTLFAPDSYSSKPQLTMGRLEIPARKKEEEERLGDKESFGT
jgi:hypothetical protein